MDYSNTTIQNDGDQFDGLYYLRIADKSKSKFSMKRNVLRRKERINDGYYNEVVNPFRQKKNRYNFALVPKHPRPSFRKIHDTFINSNDKICWKIRNLQLNDYVDLHVVNHMLCEENKKTINNKIRIGRHLKQCSTQ